ncbi:MAG: VOC family protein [Gammaproteobacteria bacterium]
MIEITRFLNVSMIVRDMDEALRDYEALFGFRSAYRVDVPEMACDSAILPAGAGYALELVAVLDTRKVEARAGAGMTYSPQEAERIVRDFLARRGEGVYRLAFEVADFDAARQHLCDRGVRHAYYDLDLPTGRNQVIIVHPKATSGIMFELLPPGVYDRSTLRDAWPAGATGVSRRFMNVACVVRDLAGTRRAFEDLLGLAPHHTHTVPALGVTLSMFELGGDEVLEIMEPMATALRGTPGFNAQGARDLEGFLEKRGEGIYKLALEVHDFDAALARLDAAHARYVHYELPLDTGPLRMAVVHPRSAHGVMFELCEPGNPAIATKRPAGA